MRSLLSLPSHSRRTSHPRLRPRPPRPLPRRISRAVPAFASSAQNQPAGNANDAYYGTQWRSAGTPAWAAYDLSAVPAARRERVAIAWYNDPVTPDYDPTLINVNAYNLPSDYTIEGNRAGGGTPPADGWTTLTTVTANRYHSRQHLVDLAEAWS